MLKEKLSYSFASKLLITMPEVIKYELENPRESSDAMDNGNRIEYCLANGLDDLKVLNYKSRTEKFRNERDSIIASSELYKSHPYLICLENKRVMCEEMLDKLSFQVKQIIKNSKKQTHFELDDFDVPVHGYTDLETDDCVYELKFTDPTPDKFSKQVLNFGWHIQAYLYSLYASKTERQFKWLVVGNTPPYVQRIYNLCDMRYIERGQADFERAIELFKEFNKDKLISIEQYIDAPSWC